MPDSNLGIKKTEARLINIDHRLAINSNLKNNFGLTITEYNLLEIKVRHGDETLFHHIYCYHFKACIKFLKYKFRISEERAHDVCMDTMIDFRQKLLNNKIKYGNLAYLFSRIASNIYLDSKKKKQKVESAIHIFLEGTDLESDNQEHFLSVLGEAIDKLDDRNKILLKEMYYANEDVNDIAMRRNITYATLRKRKQRMIEKLKSIVVDFIEKKGKN